MNIKQINFVLDCLDANELAEFYSKLLDWQLTHPYTSGWAAIISPTGEIIAFQEVDNYKPSVWPWEDEKQGQMIHMDIVVDDLQEGVKFALACGDVEAKEQYFETSRTMIDPAGHPFCIDT